jgi:hypothetical protein
MRWIEEQFARETVKTSTTLSLLAKVALIRGVTLGWSRQDKIEVFREMLTEALKVKPLSGNARSE